MKRATVLLLLATISFAAPADHTDVGVTTVILVRHAEKVVDASLTDPPLTDAGQERARELARVVGSSDATVVYTTPFARTRQTAAPLAAALKVEPIEVKTGGTYAADMANIIRAKHEGQTVVIVGHSNTTRDVMRQLGVTAAPDIAESEYDNLFIVTLAPGMAPHMMKLRYGTVAR